MTKYIGLDVHVNDTVACVLDKKTNSFSYETVKTTPFSLKRFLKKHSEAHATMEVSGLTSNLYDDLRPLVKDLVVSNPSQIPWMWKSGKKNDRIDAKKQATLLSMGHLPVVYMPSKAVRKWRALIGHRRSLMDDCKRVKNRVRSLINAHCLRNKGEGTRWTLKNMRWLWSLTDPEGAQYLGEDDAERLSELLKTIEFFREMIKRVTERLDRIAEKHVGVQLLMTIPGIGPRTAEAVIAYADDVKRFARSKEFPAYFGIVPTLDESGSVRRMGHISKRGPSAVRWLIVESAWRVVARSKAIREFFLRVTHGQRSRRKIAIVAVARKVLTIMRAMLLTGAVWDERLAAPPAPSLA
jgi:transposase